MQDINYIVIYPDQEYFTKYILIDPRTGTLYSEIFNWSELEDVHLEPLFSSVSLPPVQGPIEWEEVPF